MKNFELGKTYVRTSVGTWWDSALYAVEISYVLYLPDFKEKLFEEGCAEIFSECNY